MRLGITRIVLRGIEDTLRPFDKAQGGEPVEPKAQGRLRKPEKGLNGRHSSII